MLLTRKVSGCLLAAIVIAAALGLGACSRSPHVSQVAGPGAGTFAKGPSGGGGGGGGGVAPPPVLPPPPPAVSPCVSLVGMGGTVINQTAILKMAPGRLRMDVTGDVATGAIDLTGACAATDAPAISYVGGTGNAVLAGSTNSITATGLPLAFGALLFPGAALEPGTVLATDAAGNTLQIVWPALAGLPPGPPTLRLNLASWNTRVRSGRSVDVRMTFTAVAPDASTATFTVAATNLLIP